MTRLLFALALLTPLSVAAQIYKTTDEDGNVVFTDRPSADSGTGERIELKPTNTAPPPPEVHRPEPEPEPEEELVEYSVKIVTPTNETTIPMGPGNFLTSAKIEPNPEPGELVQLHVDGIPWGDPQKNASWALTNVFRGAHDLTVTLLDTEGAPLATSEPVRVYVLRPSINNRNRN